MLRRTLVDLIVAAIIVASFGLMNSAQAMSVSPLRYDLTVEPGAGQIVKVTVRNIEGGRHQYKLGVVGVMPDQLGRPLFAKQIDIAESWATPEVKGVTLSGNQEQVVPFTITVPKDASPGEHLIGLTVDEQAAGSTSTTLSGRLVVLVKLMVAGTVTEALEVRVWQPLNWLEQNSVWKFQGELLNKGTVAVPLRAEMVVVGRRGQAIINQPISVGAELFPGALRQLHSDISIPSSVRSGIYTVQLDVVYGKTHTRVSQGGTVWYVPRATAQAVVAVVCIIIIAIVAVVIRRHKKSVSK